MEKFNIEKQFQAYLKRVGLSEALMPKEQTTELRRAFFGSWGQFLVILQQEVIITEEEAFKVLDDMQDQVANFWLRETKNQN